jgi:hypothetical protein
MPICKETITIAIPNPKNPQETAVRDKTIKFENRHRGIIKKTHIKQNEYGMKYNKKVRI